MAIGIINKTGSKGVLSLNCRFDFKCIREFRELYEPLLSDDAITAIEINMGGVEYIDSTALGMLLSLRDKAKNMDKEIIIGDCQGTARKVLELSNFDKIFNLT